MLSKERNQTVLCRLNELAAKLAYHVPPIDSRSYWVRKTDKLRNVKQRIIPARAAINLDVIKWASEILQSPCSETDAT